MASSIQLLRSTNPQERPFSGNLLEGQPAVNLHPSEPGLFFKASDGSIVKFGPAAITSDGSPPNSSPEGSPGNSVGELWLDKSEDPAVLKVYDGTVWINAGSGGGGGGGGAGAFVRWIYTAVGGETSLSGTSNGVLLDYTPGLEEVFVNGVLLTRDVDYSATNGSSITNLSPLAAGDVITVLSMNPLEVVELPGQVTLLRWTIPAAAGQTVLSGVDSSSQQLSYTAGFEEVYVNGAFLRRGIDYTATDGETISMTTPLLSGDEVTVMAWSAFQVGQGGGGGGQVTLLRWFKLAVDGQTSITGADSLGQVLSYYPSFEQVYINGTLLSRGEDYTANDGSSILLNEALLEDDEITVLAWSAFEIGGQIPGSSIIPGTVTSDRLSGDIPGSLIEDSSIDAGKLSFPIVTPDADSVLYDWGSADSSRPTVERSVYDFIKDGIVSVKDFGAVGDGVTDDSDAVEAAMNVGNARTCYFPPGTYRLTRTLRKSTQSALVGAFPTAPLQFGLPVSKIYGTVEDLGVGAPLIRCSGQNQSSQAHRFINLTFQSNLPNATGKFHPETDQGVNGVDVAGAKQGIDFHNCSFKSLVSGVVNDTSWSTAYVDMVTYNTCYFSSCYLAVNHSSSVGLQFSHCQFDECYNWISTVSDVLLTGCRFNNSTYTQEFTQVKGDRITAINCWIEKGNNWFAPASTLILDNCHATAADSTLGSTKFWCIPQGDGVSIIMRGVRRAQFVRLINFANVTDRSTISLRMESVGGPEESAFGNDSSFASNLQSNLSFRGEDCFLGTSNLSGLRYNTVREKGPILLGEMGSDKSGIRERGMIQPCRTYFRPGSTWDNNRNFSIQIYNAYNSHSGGTNSDYNAFIKLLLIGDDNGAGGSNSYNAECLIHKAYGTNWVATLSGKDPTAWTVAFSNQTTTSTDVEVTINHPGSVSNNAMFILSSSEGVEIVHPN